MEEFALHDAPTATTLRRRAARGLIIGAAASLMLAFAGAWGTDQAPLAQRIAYWAAVVLPGSVLGLGTMLLVRGWGGLASRRSLEAALVALLVSIPHCFLVIVASAVFFGMSVITVATVLQFWLVVLLISSALTAINYLSAAGEPMKQSDGQSPPVARAVALTGDVPKVVSDTSLPTLPPLLADRLPLRLRAGRLIAIESEDHYLRVHTDLGSDLLLMRMADACLLLSEASGTRVHRSWWVARAAVVGRTVSKGRMSLELTGKLTAPVSRTMQAVLKRDGW